MPILPHLLAHERGLASGTAATWIGKGKVEQIQQLVEQHDAKIVVFDADLAPRQVRNLEKVIKARVVDRSGLILDIFAGRARSREARTQVELAQLQYLLPRLTRQWTRFDRRWKKPSQPIWSFTSWI